jgi:excisionase family DNA binding protein
MNLADAIRRAVSETQRPAEAFAGVEPLERASPRPGAARPQEEPTTPRAAAHGPGHVARLELILTPEQMAKVLKAALLHHRSVMSLREAAAYLRCTARTLQELAAQGEVPALMIDGHWRFPKQAIDDWLAARAAGEQERRKHDA